MALRALNQHVPGPAVAGCRTPSDDANPPPFVPPAPENLNLIRGDGTLTVTWHHARTATGYRVDYSTNGGQSWAMAVWSNNTTSTTLRGMDNATAYTVRVRGHNNRGDGPWSESVTVAGLAAGSVADTTATLTLTGHTAAWYYMAYKTPHNTCNSVNANTASVNLTNLTANTEYTYKAYDKSGCDSADEIASVTFTTAPTPGSRDSSKDFNTLSAAGNNDVRGIWSDGTTMWVVDQYDDKVYAYNLASKARDASKDFSLPTEST